jgi:predicted membrane protein
MEVINDPRESEQDSYRDWERRHRRNRIMAGFIFIGIGGLLTAKAFGVEFPSWILSWKMLLIVIGLFLFSKPGGRNIGGLAMIITGGIFLLGDIMPDWNIRHLILPAVFICVGIVILARPSKKKERYAFRHRHGPWNASKANDSEHEKLNPDEHLELNAIFGGMRKKILSKQFRGGEVNSIFGSVELDLSQADFKSVTDLEINSIFGGTTLIVPSNWEIQSNVDVIMGSVDDKRAHKPAAEQSDRKLLKLDGAAVFGGITIKDY